VSFESLWGMVAMDKDGYQVQEAFPRKRFIEYLGVALCLDEEELRGQELQRWLLDVLWHFDQLGPTSQNMVKNFFDPNPPQSSGAETAETEVVVVTQFVNTYPERSGTKSPPDEAEGKADATDTGTEPVVEDAPDPDPVVLVDEGVGDDVVIEDAATGAATSAAEVEAAPGEGEGVDGQAGEEVDAEETADGPVDDGEGGTNTHTHTHTVVIQEKIVKEHAELAREIVDYIVGCRDDWAYSIAELEQGVNMVKHYPGRLFAPKPQPRLLWLDLMYKAGKAPGRLCVGKKKGVRSTKVNVKGVPLGDLTDWTVGYEDLDNQDPSYARIRTLAQASQSMYILSMEFGTEDEAMKFDITLTYMIYCVRNHIDPKTDWSMVVDIDTLEASS